MVYRDEDQFDRVCRLLREERAKVKTLYQYLDAHELVEDAIEWMHATGQPVRHA